MHETQNRLNEAKLLSEDILADIELNRIPLPQVFLKVKRLGRLLRDTDVQRWIDLELSGYPLGFHFASLGVCEKYLRNSSRVTGDKYYGQSLPELLSMHESETAILQNLKFPSNMSPSLSSSNQYEHVGMNLNKIIMDLAKNFNSLTVKHATNKNFYYKLINGLTSAVHNYVSDVNIALTFGDIVTNEIEKVRMVVDKFIQKECPKSVEQLVSIFERAREGTSESYSQALVSCRRVLMSVADSVFPAQAEPYIDSQGKSRKVGREDYKNRLLAFLDKNISGNGSKDIFESQIGHLAARLDAVYEKSCKGVHADIGESEARLAILHTYLFIAEIAGVPQNNES